MNLYKSKIIKSEAVRIVERKEAGTSAGDHDKNTIPSINAGAAVAEDRFHQVVRESFERGFAEGIKKGRQFQIRADHNALKASEDVVNQIGQLMTTIVERSEEEILGLVFAIAEKVIHHEVTVNRDIIRGVLKSAVTAMNEREQIKVKCNPVDLAELNLLRPELLATVDGLRHVEFVEDPSIMPGGVKVETDIGEVDARIEKQFEVIKNAVLS